MREPERTAGIKETANTAQLTLAPQARERPSQSMTKLPSLHMLSLAASM
jgi:hypothetical protein